MNRWNKRGKLYVMLLCGIMIIILIAMGVKLASYYAKGCDPKLKCVVGEKQALVLDAVREGERINLFVQEASAIAATQSKDNPTCNDNYLGRPFVGRSECKDDLKNQYMQSLYAQLAQYPDETLTSLSLDIKPSGRAVTASGTKKIVIGEDRLNANIPTTSFDGTFGLWPVEKPVITSAFGNRDLKLKKSTKNHPGMDFAVDNKLTPILSVTNGLARYHEAGEYSYIEVRSDDLLVRYMHTRPVSGITTNSDTLVVAGQQIGVPRDFTAQGSGGKIHLHFEVIIPSISSSMAKSAWPTHVGPSNLQTKENPSFGVIKGETFFLNPVCFFDRELASLALETSNILKDDSFAACDAYEDSFALSSKFSRATQLSSTTQSTVDPSTVNVSQLSADLQNAPPEVQLTYKRLSDQNLLPLIQDAASKNGISSELLLAIITQESKGNPDAASSTGALGIAQFVYPTAHTYFEPQDRDALVNCAGKPCDMVKTQGDPRRNPEKAIYASAKYLAYLHKLFAEYEHADTLTIAAYNGGEGTLQDATKRAGGKDASWEAVSAALGTLPGRVDERQIRDYVEKVRRWYVAWGGSGFVGTSFSSTQLGYYDLRVSVHENIPQGIAAGIEAIDKAVNNCNTQNCVESAVTSTPIPGNLEVFEITGASGSCLSNIEETQLLFANQLQWCKNSPDTSCTCPLASVSQASFIVSAETLTLLSSNGQLLSAKDTPASLIGLEDDTSGDSEQLVSSVRYTNKNGISNEQVQATLTTATAQTPSLSNAGPVSYLEKISGGLAFRESDSMQCVSAPQPKAYCIRDKSDYNRKLLFFVDQSAHSNPQSAIHDIIVDEPNKFPIGIQYWVKVTFQATVPYRAVHVTVREVQVGTAAISTQTYFEDYLPFVQDGANPLLTEQKQQELSGLHQGVAMFDGTTYTIYVPYHQDSEVVLSFVDENMQETTPAAASMP